MHVAIQRCTFTTLLCLGTPAARGPFIQVHCSVHALCCVQVEHAELSLTVSPFQS